MLAYKQDEPELVVVQRASTVGVRFTALRFNDNATLDKGVMGPMCVAISTRTQNVRTRNGVLIRKGAENDSLAGVRLPDWCCKCVNYAKQRGVIRVDLPLRSIESPIPHTPGYDTGKYAA